MASPFPKMARKLYFSPIGTFFSLLQNFAAILNRPFMVYGNYNRVRRKFSKTTRISSSVTIINKKKLDIADNVWVWHYTIIDASNSVTIGQGTQIGAWVGIFTHGSHLAIRLMGERYIETPKEERFGYQRKPVVIGSYTFIGAGAIILPGAQIGNGCIISAGSVVSGKIPDYSIVQGNPAGVVGSVINLDKKYFKKDIVRESYFDKGLMDDYLKKKNAK